MGREPVRDAFVVARFLDARERRQHLSHRGRIPAGARRVPHAEGVRLELVVAAVLEHQHADSGLGVLMLKYSRDDELQADTLSVRYASRAGWDPSAMTQMLTTLARIEESSDDKGVPNWLATHPASESRVERVASAAEQAEAGRGSSELAGNREEYLRRVDGIV